MRNLTQFELPEILPPLTAAEKQELREAKELPFVYDEDCPPQTEEELQQFKRVVPKVA